MTPEQYCQNKTAQSGSSFYYSFLFLPPEQRRAMTALYAFCREVDDIADECKDENIARTKINWWREEIIRLFQGTQKHPVSLALGETISNYNIPAEYFIEILDGMEMDINKQTYPTFKELSLYCYRVAGVVGLMSAEIFGYENRNTQKYAKNLGTAFQLTNILRDVGADLKIGRCYLPQEDMDQFHVTLADLQSNAIPADHVRELLAFQGQRAHYYYEQAFTFLPDEDRYSQLCGVIMSAIYRQLLVEIENEKYRVLDQRISLTPIRKLWLAWRCSKKEKRAYKKLAH